MTNVFLHLNNSNKCTYAAQHPWQVQSQHLLFLHLDPTACHVSSISSLQWVIPMSEKKIMNIFQCLCVCTKNILYVFQYVLFLFFSPYVWSLTKHWLFVSDSRAHSSRARAKYFFGGKIAVWLGTIKVLMYI